MACVFDVFTDMLVKERHIEVRDFGVFVVRQTPARVGRNPLTRESAEVPARNIIRFKAGKKMKEAVNESEMAED